MPCTVAYLTCEVPLHAKNMYKLLCQKVPGMVIVISQIVQDGRPWGATMAGLPVRVQKTLAFKRIGLSKKLGWDPPTVLFPLSTYRDLKAVRPAVIISMQMGFRSLLAWWYCRWHRECKLVIQARVSNYTEQRRGLLRNLLRRFLLRRAAHVIVNGQSGLQYLTGLGLAPARATVINSGTDTEVFGHVHAAYPDRPQLNILYVGQLVPRKNLLGTLPWLLQEIQRSGRPVKFTIAGWGPQKAEVLACLAAHDLEVEFLDHIAYEQLPAIYAQADVFFMPTLADEWAMTVNEALATGVPVLGSVRAQAVSELIQDGITGWVFDPLDEAASRLAFQRMLSATRADFARIGTAGRQVAQRCSDLSEAAQFAGVIDQVQGR